ncbi:preprotein translocase subunit SecG [Helicobacter valdiviensis]|uniref:Protein-export membrane protein SecG n=1 Tax=Helicobacter valdiviensis TaxID=1458358 RepID=A0A2W6MXP4_9HELI|nr:preprotein translocase subunit SecG [Helicobacter valdiviensis]PZT47978.1 preprotein translocase subunit SecG [Helicobacter valdiviensis]
MISILLVLQFVLAVIITIVVLLQKSSSIGLGAYSGSNESLFGAKGPAGFLAKLTFVLGVLFVINTIALGYLYTKDSKSSIVDNMVVPSTQAPVAPSVPNVPVANEGNTTSTQAPSTPSVAPQNPSQN